MKRWCDGEEEDGKMWMSFTHFERIKTWHLLFLYISMNHKNGSDIIVKMEVIGWKSIGNFGLRNDELDRGAEISHLVVFLFRQSACLIGVNKSVARGSVKFSRTNGGWEKDEENDLKKFTIWRKEKIEEKNRSTDKGAKREKWEREKNSSGNL